MKQKIFVEHSLANSSSCVDGPASPFSEEHIRILWKRKVCDPLSTYIVCPGLDLRIEPMLVFIPKWRITNQQNVEDDTAGPNVHGFSVRLLLQNLGREVAGSAGKA